MSDPRSSASPDDFMVQVRITEARIRELVKDQSALVQLDAALSAYINLATQHGELALAGQALLRIGASLVFTNQPAQTLPFEVTPSSSQHLH